MFYSIDGDLVVFNLKIQPNSSQNKIKKILSSLGCSLKMSRKKIKVFLGVDIKNFYYLLVSLDTKSRFLQKNAKELLEFVLPLSEVKFQKNKKILFSKAPMCGKAKEFLKSMGWRVL